MEARTKFNRLTGVNTEIEGISVYQTSLLLFPPTTKVVTQAICIFNAATWVERTNYFRLLAVPLPPEACANWLANAAYGFWRSHNGWNKIKRTLFIWNFFSRSRLDFFKKLVAILELIFAVYNQ